MCRASIQGDCWAVQTRWADGPVSMLVSLKSKVNKKESGTVENGGKEMRASGETTKYTFACRGFELCGKAEQTCNPHCSTEE